MAKFIIHNFNPMQAAGKVVFHAKPSKLLLHGTRLSLSLASPKIGCRRSPYASAIFKQGNGLTWLSAQPGLLPLLSTFAIVGFAEDWLRRSPYASNMLKDGTALACPSA